MRGIWDTPMNDAQKSLFSRENISQIFFYSSSSPFPFSSAKGIKSGRRELGIFFIREIYSNAQVLPLRLSAAPPYLLGRATTDFFFKDFFSHVWEGVRPRSKTNECAPPPPPSSPLCVTAAAAHVNRTRSLLSFLLSICVWTASSPVYEEIRRCLSGEKKYCTRRLCDLEPAAPGKSGKIDVLPLFRSYWISLLHLHSQHWSSEEDRETFFFASFHWEVPAMEALFYLVWTRNVV